MPDASELGNRYEFLTNGPVIDDGVVGLDAFGVASRVWYLARKGFTPRWLDADCIAAWALAEEGITMYAIAAPEQPLLDIFAFLAGSANEPR